MRRNNIFGVLENAEDSSMDRLIEMCPEITDEELEKILKKSEKKYKERKKEMNRGITMTSNDSIEGVERSSRPAWMSGLSIAASLILIVGVIAGSTVLMRSGRVDHGGEDIPPAVSVTTATGTGTTQTVTGTGHATGTETTAVRDAAETNVSSQSAVSSANTAKTETVSAANAADTANEDIKPFVGSWICQESSCGLYPVTEGARDLGIVYINADSTYRYTDRSGSESAGTVSVRNYEFANNEFTELRFSGELSGMSTFQYAHTESSDELYNGNGGMARIIRNISNAPLTQYGWKKEYQSVLDHYEKYQNSAEMSWNIHDLDGDGIPELFVSTGQTHISGVQIFYYEDDKVKAVSNDGEFEQVGKYGEVRVCTDEHLLGTSDINQGISYTVLQKYEDHSLTIIQRITSNEGAAGKENATYTINDVTVSEEEYNKAIEETNSKNWIAESGSYSLSDRTALN